MAARVSAAASGRPTAASDSGGGLDGDVGAGGGEGERDGSAHADGAAGDEGGAAGEGEDAVGGVVGVGGHAAGCVLSGGRDVGFGEVVAFEQEGGLVGLRAGIGEAVAHVEGGRVPAFTELRVGLERQVMLVLADGDEFQAEKGAKSAHAVAG